METIASFYNNLLAIDATIIGIITAVMFVILQIIDSNYSFRDVGEFLQRPVLWIFSFVSIITLTYTGLGSFHFVIYSNNSLEIALSGIFPSYCGLLTALILLILVLISGLILVFYGIGLLNPISLLKSHLKSLNHSNISNFLNNRYGVKEPLEPIQIIVKFTDDTENEIGDKDYKDRYKQYEDELAKAQVLKVKAEGAINVFTGVEGLILKLISKGEPQLLEDAIGEYENKLISIIKNPSNDLRFELLLKYTVEQSEVFLNCCKKMGLIFFHEELLKLLVI